MCHASSVRQSRKEPTTRTESIATATATATDSPTVLLTALHMESYLLVSPATPFNSSRKVA